MFVSCFFVDCVYCHFFCLCVVPCSSGQGRTAVADCLEVTFINQIMYSGGKWLHFQQSKPAKTLVNELFQCHFLTCRTPYASGNTSICYIDHVSSPQSISVELA